jgi:mRNA-degrading endonuclease RelE of RelBE toxin-antitoxin system
VYEVRAANETRLDKELRRVRRSRVADYDRIERAVSDLAHTPRPDGIEPLGDNVFRLRSGDWRVIYKVLDHEARVIIGGIRRRKERTYKGTSELFE